MATLPQLIEEDISVIDNALQELLNRSEATAALLIDKGGFLITQTGDWKNFDSITIAALSAASFAATQSIAALVSERNFSSVYQQGETFSLIVQNVDEYSLLAVIFRASLSVGVVRYYSGSTIRELADQLQVAKSRNPEGGLDLSMLNLADTSSLFSKKT